MTEELIVEYLINCAWQIPVLAAGAWLLVKMVRPGIVVEHWLWLAVLAMAVALPLYGISGKTSERSKALDGVVFEDSGAVKTPVPIRASQPGDTPLRGEYRSDSATVPSAETSLAVLRRTVRLSVPVTRALVWIYMATIVLGGLRFVRAWLAARRLVSDSRDAVLAPESMLALEGFGRRLGVKLPQLRESATLAGPVIVGMMQPVMLLPVRFGEHAREEIGAALFHELAHVRRRDYLVNLLCQIVALPVCWHPAVYAVQQRIRRTREMVCDAIAAEEMESGASYARCLVSLAREMVSAAERCRRTQAMGLFENNTMEERVMKLTETKVVMSGRAKALRVLCGTAAMTAVTAAALAFHVRPTFAATGIVVQSGAVTAPSADSIPAVTPAPAPAAQAKPSAQVVGPEKAPLAITRGSHPNVTVGKGEYVHRWKSADGEPFTLVNRDPKEPSLEEQRAVEMQLVDSQKAIDEAKKWLNDPKFKLDFKLNMEELQHQLGSIDMKAQLEAANQMANSPAMKLRMDGLQKELSRLDAMPELQKFNDPEWQKQFAELQKTPPHFDFDFQKQLDTAKLAMNDAKLNELLAKSLKGQDERLAKLQKEIGSGELKEKLDKATQLLNEVQRQMDTMHAK